MKTRLFEIQTLSEGRRLADPVTIITGGLALLSSLFPNIFGGARRRLTSAYWLQLMPGNGYWTTALRNHLENTIHYDTDVANIQPFTKYFVHENQASICPEMNLQNYPAGTFSRPSTNFSKSFFSIFRPRVSALSLS